MKAKVQFRIFLITVFSGIIISMPLYLKAESVFLKDGSIIKGTITGGDDFRISLSTDRENIKIERKDILRILVHERYRDRIYLTQVNGVTIEGYIVNEDNIQVTLRSSLDSSEEINIPREKIETISLKKPSERLLAPSVYSSVFLKNGEIIDCRIVRETARIIDTKSLTGERRIILRSDIMRTQYNNSYKDKKVLRKLDGTRIEGYIMEEDSVSYTYRRELYSPAEERIFKSDLRSIGKK
jgi:sRNA-binding regulator protein Hfq